MKSVYVNIVLTLIFPTLLFAQGISDDKNKRYFKFYPKKHSEIKLNSSINMSVRVISIELQLELNKEFNRNLEKINILNDSTKIYLRSGTNWFVQGNPPKKPILFFLKFFFMHDNIDVQKRIDYCEFVATFENLGKMPYHLIEKIEFKTELLNSNNKKYLATYFMLPDSTRNLNYSVERKKMIEMKENLN